MRFGRSIYSTNLNLKCFKMVTVACPGPSCGTLLCSPRLLVGQGSGRVKKGGNRMEEVEMRGGFVFTGFSRMDDAAGSDYLLTVTCCEFSVPITTSATVQFVALQLCVFCCYLITDVAL